ncbi:hypothetical protein PIB30_008432 [Stylosanthes scabra]|uniref:Uncharacterized protein n=1 Tax=Stylosanthes scabra TaxID=79078 RepID=A0ABU6W5J6_9FABA|nr:hypothetical protein [Stylosanthes scabra]
MRICGSADRIRGCLMQIRYPILQLFGLDPLHTRILTVDDAVDEGDENSTGCSAEVGVSIRGKCTSSSAAGRTTVAMVTNGGLRARWLRRFVSLTPPPLLVVVLPWNRGGDGKQQSRKQGGMVVDGECRVVTVEEATSKWCPSSLWMSMRRDYGFGGIDQIAATSNSFWNDGWKVETPSTMVGPPITPSPIQRFIGLFQTETKC